MSINPINSSNGVVCYLPKERFGYFGWPSIARQDDGTLLVVASGLRAAHVCPWGKTVICRSRDNGVSWSYPQVINDTPMDDRDAGIISLGGQRVAVTWFTSNTTVYHKPDPVSGWPAERREEGVVLDSWELPMCCRNIGSWIRISPDGYYWGEPMQAPVNTPHGFIVLKDGSWLYLGKRWDINRETAMHVHNSPIAAIRSRDEGRTWEMLGTVPLPEDCTNNAVHEPHVLELRGGGLLGAIRTHKTEAPFRVTLTRSWDGGRSWTQAEEFGTIGSPPHLLRHSSGAIVMVYGYRLEPYGQRARVSYDEGQTWDEEILLRTDGPCSDLGYPASVELPGGKIMTIYYQALQHGDKPGILYTIWELPAKV
ncbi:MAG: exo-alpha-sialidase [Oligosphaeraceae bacterium]|nr:exo-alpha-sialidase [Oligosphaeraceae bacterium]